MNATNESKMVAKLLTYVFDDEAPLPIEERLDLTDGIYLAPIPPFLLTADHDYHLLAIEPRFSQFARDHLHKSTLNVIYTGSKNLNYEGKNTAEESAKQKVNDYLISAAIHTPSFCAPYASFVTIPSENRICHSSPMKNFAPINQTCANLLTETDFTSINRLYAVLKEIIAPEATGKLTTAITYYQQAFRYDIYLPVRFLGLMMAMESIFGNSGGEISHQVAERSAFFLKQTPKDREKFYISMKKYYSLRSKIAHGGSPNYEKEKLSEAFKLMLNLLRDALVKILEDATLLRIFQDDKKFDEAMRKLVFYGSLETCTEAD